MAYIRKSRIILRETSLNYASELSGAGRDNVLTSWEFHQKVPRGRKIVQNCPKSF